MNMSFIGRNVDEHDAAAEQAAVDDNTNAIRSIRRELSVISTNMVREAQLAQHSLDAIRLGTGTGKQELLLGHAAPAQDRDASHHNSHRHNAQDSHSWKSSIIQEKQAFRSIIQASVNLAKQKELHLEELLECQPLLQVLQAVSSIGQSVQQVATLIDLCQAGAGAGAGTGAGAEGLPDLQAPGLLLAPLRAAVDQLPGE